MNIRFCFVVLFLYCGTIREVFNIINHIKIDKEILYGKISGDISVNKKIYPEDENYNLEIWEANVKFAAETQTAVARIIISLRANIETPEFLLPSIWIKDNRFSQDKVYSPLIKRLIVREDRLPIPLVLTRGDNGDTFAILKIPAKADSSVGMNDDSDEIVYHDDTDISGLGFDYEKKELILTFLFEEYPFLYRRKLFMTYTKKESKKAFTLLEKGKIKEINFFIIKGKTSSFNSAVSKLWTISYDKFFGEKETTLNKNLEEKVKKALTNYFKKYYHDGKIKGFLPYVNTYDGKVTLKYLESGFTGMVLLNARNSIELGREFKDEELIKMGENTLDSWITYGRKNKIFVDCYDISTDSICDNPPYFFSDSFFTRRAFESLMAYYLAFSSEKKRGIERNKWKEVFIEGSTELLKYQNSDGSFSRSYSYEGKVKDPGPAGTLFAPPVFIMAYRIKNDPIFLNAAKKSGEVILKFVENYQYYGSTLDANSEDKEAAMWALYSCFLLYKETNEEIYRKCTEESLYATLMWFFLWDVPFSNNQLFSKINLKTTGLGAVSVENNHIDVYSFFLPKILKDISDIDKKRLTNFSNIILNSILEVVPIEGNSKGSVVGIVPEVIQQTWWDYGFYGKGNYNLTSATGWAVASVLSSLYAEEF